MIKVEVIESGASLFILFHTSNLKQDYNSLYDFTDLENIHQTLRETKESLFIA